MLSYSLAVADAHWLSLNPRLEGLIVPSKFYGIAAAGKPIVVIGDKNGEIAQRVQQHGCGIVIAPGDVDALYGRCRIRQRRFQKWGSGREQRLTRILRGGERSSDGASCSVSSMKRTLSRRCNRRWPLLPTVVSRPP
jgi:hypothetical protein